MTVDACKVTMKQSKTLRTRIQKRITAGFDGQHIEPGQPGNPTAYRICGAHAHATGQLCTRPAGWGTWHPGSGRCKMHWGNAPSGPTKKGGRYSAVYLERMQQAIEAISEEDEQDILDVTPELNLQRALLALLIRQLESSGQPYQVQPRLTPVEMAVLVQETRSRAGTAYPEGRPAAGDVWHSDGVGHDDTMGVGGVGIPTDGYMSDHGVVPLTGFFSENNPPVSIELAAEIRLLVQSIVDTVMKITSAKNQTALTTAEVTYILSVMREAIAEYVPQDRQRAFVDHIRVKLGERMGVKLNGA